MARTPNRPQIGTPLADVLAQLAQNFDTIDDQDETKIIRNGGTPALLLGRQVGGFGGLDYGLKITKPGFDVTTATDGQLAFTSAYNTLRIVKTGTLDITNSGDSFETASVAHELSGPKMLMGYATSDWNPGVFFPLPYTRNDAAFSTGGSIDWQATMYVTATDVVAEVSAVVATGAPINTYDGITTFRYYLLQETAN